MSHRQSHPTRTKAHCFRHHSANRSFALPLRDKHHFSCTVEFNPQIHYIAKMNVKVLLYSLFAGQMFAFDPSMQSSFTMTTPYSVPWVAVIENFDITDPNEDELALLTQDCFRKCPVMVFRNNYGGKGEPTSKEFFAFVKRFDPDVDVEAIENQDILHPFRQDEDEPHVATRAERNEEHKNELGDQFRWGPVWHMDLVGSKKTAVPNVVSAFHFLDVPEEGGNTIYANMNMAYAMFPPELKREVDTLQCVYDNDLNSLFNFELDQDGFTRLGPFPKKEEEDQVVRPLVRRDKSSGKKRMFFTPVRFNRFVGWSTEQSWEFIAYIFHTFVNTPRNAVSIKWKRGDVAVFNNDALIHTSAPWELHKGKKRVFRLCFLNSKKMYEDD